MVVVTTAHAEFKHLLSAPFIEHRLEWKCAAHRRDLMAEASDTPSTELVDASELMASIEGDAAFF